MNPETALPRATYRVQLNRDFRFRDAASIVPQLAALGISHLYVSPILEARAGSRHGYDVVDFSRLNPELGSRADFDALVAALHAHRMGLVVDVVANHMGILANDNAWWLDVLENGPAATYAKYFDIDWQPPRASLRDRILVPVLGEPFGVSLEKGELRVRFDRDEATFSAWYYDHRFPLDPRETWRVFDGQDAERAAQLEDDPQAREDFESLMDEFARLPSRSDTSEAARTRRYRDKEVFRRRLGRLCERSPSLQAYIDASLERLNGTVGEPASFDSLAALLEAQAYRLAYWRVAGDEINYRRFFDINDLAALRVDDPEVFEATHAVILELVAAGQVDGLRIDHPDGLYDPAQYFERLQARFRDPAAADPRPLYVVAEKILASHERLPADWAVHGTTGYDFMQLVDHWLLTAQAEEPMTRAYQAFTGRRWDFEQIVLDSKRQVMRGSLAAEVAVLTTQLDRIAQLDRHTSDLTRNGLRDAIIDTIACFPVYRTYVSATALGDEDRHAVNWAINVARRSGQAADPSALEFLRAVLLGEAAQGLPEAQRVAMLEFAIKFQQVTAPVMAKGVEDTSFYIYNRLVSLNEVGGDPRRFGLSTAALHRANADRLRHWPQSMLATSTHDTKRSEDARARGAALTQFAAPWRRHLGRWSRINRSRRRLVDGRPAPSRNDEYLLYQTLLAVWPPGEDAPPDGLLERLVEYATKAAREAKVETSWVNPNPGYEQALAAFLEPLLAPGLHNAFLRDLHGLRRAVAYHGWLASLSQTLLKATSPGVPDFYQGNEIPTFRLVDPDNRAPVDFPQLARLQAAMRRDCQDEAALPAYVAALLRQWEDGRAKLYLTWRALQRRSEDPALFTAGGYEALRITGSHADHLCAFLRTHGNRRLLVVASRDTSSLVDGALAPPLGEACWPDTRIELPGLGGAVLRDALAGRALRVEDDPEMPWIRVATLLAAFPVALATCEVGTRPG